jgi:hypothetical protein
MTDAFPAEIIPSYLTKVREAKEDLNRLQVEIDAFAARKRYTVIERAEGKRKPKVRRLSITASPRNTDIPTITGGIAYKLRSGLDHLMSALMPTEQAARKGMFPIYFQGVWEPDTPGDNEQRRKERGRWQTDIRGLSDDVLAILKWAQPPDVDIRQGDELHVLVLVNLLANLDDHTKPPVVVTGLENCLITWDTPDGGRGGGFAAVDLDARGRRDRFIENHAELKNVPYSAMNVQIEGAPLVAVHIASQDRYAPLPAALDHAAKAVEEIINRLYPLAVR